MALTTFYPTTYLASRILGDTASVKCPVPPDADPALWLPSRDDLAAYQKAGLIIINGAGFEKWLATASLPESRVVDTTAPLRAELIAYESVTHSHGPTGAHSHTGTDGHTWLDPANAKAQAAEIARAAISHWPGDAAAIHSRLDALTTDLDRLDARLHAASPLARDAVLMASHPAYNYLSRRYSLGIINIPMDPASPPHEPTLTAIAASIARQPNARTRLMLWEEPPPAEVAAFLLDHFAIRSVLFGPCESLAPEDAAAGHDFLTMMTANIDRLEQALAHEP